MELKIKEPLQQLFASDRDGRNSVTSNEENCGIKYFTRGSIMIERLSQYSAFWTRLCDFENIQSFYWYTERSKSSFLQFHPLLVAQLLLQD